MNFTPYKHVIKDNTCLSVNEQDNCAVVALSISLDIPYTRARELAIKNCNFEPKKGTPYNPLIKYLRCLFKEVEIPYKSTFNQFKKKYYDPEKNYFVIVTGHAFVIKDDTIIGMTGDNKHVRKRILKIFTFKKDNTQLLNAFEIS